jgi:type VI secretion system secreted protein VgrG
MSEVSAQKAQYSFKVAGQTFQVLHFEAYEEISVLSKYSLTLWSDDPEVDIASLIRQDADIKVLWGSDEKHFYGIVSRFSQTDAGKPGAGGVDKVWGEYSVEVVPTFWLLSQKTNCKIFQNMSTDEIIKKVLDGRGMSGKYDPRMKGYPTREYCVQYRESDYAFVCRLMEEEGMFFYFSHQGKELMVIGDDMSHFGTCAPESSVEFKTLTGGLATSKEYVSGITYSENAFIGKIKFKDYDYRDPKKPLEVEKTGSKNTDLEVYDYQPERYRDDGRGRNLADVLKDAEQCWKKYIGVTGNWRSASSGCKFNLSKAYRGDLNGEWLVASMSHTANQQAETGVEYAVSFYALPTSVTYRTFPTNPRPVINPQTAKVVGPKGAKIHMDSLGRAKVQFRWDLDGKEDEKSSCYLRVAQPYAGIDEDTQKKHGFQWHPLIGDEVVVDFLEGDPDKPVIVGSAYNAVNTPPIKPEELIRSVVLTPYQHRLLMDDKNTAITLNTGGSETVKLEDAESSTNFGNNIKVSTADGHYLHMADGSGAQGITIETRKNNLIVLDDKKRNILIRTTDGHEAILDDANRTIKITSTNGHRVEISDQGSFIELADTGGNTVRMDAAGGNITIRATNNLDVTAGTNITITAGGSMSTTVGGSKRLSVGGKEEEQIGSTRTVLIGGHRVTTVGGKDTLNVGSTYLLTSGGKVTIKAASSVGIKGSSISEVAGGQIKSQAGSKNTMKAGTKAEVNAGSQAMIKGAIVKVQASGIATVKGALVKIN